MRQTTERITLRFTRDERKVIAEGIGATLDSWRGTSHHCRAAILAWARGVLGAERARKIQEAVKVREVRAAAGKARVRP